MKTSGAGLYLQTMGARRAILTFDNMGNRLVSCSTDWTKYELVIDVPSEADNISMGAILRGTGRLYIAGLKFEEVGKAVEPTDRYSFGCRGIWYKEPRNLDFKVDEDVQENISEDFAGTHPKDWLRRGSKDKRYHAGADILEGETEPLVGCIKSVEAVDEFERAMLFQKFDGTPYRDQRVRFSAQTKCAEIAYRCGLQLGVMDIYSQDLLYRNTFAKHDKSAQLLQGADSGAFTSKPLQGQPGDAGEQPAGGGDNSKDTVKAILDESAWRVKLGR